MSGWVRFSAISGLLGCRPREPSSRGRGSIERPYPQHREDHVEPRPGRSIVAPLNPRETKPMSLASSKTIENLKAAFAGESQANRRYLYFAQKADVEGYN